jgi:hypothetical protein
LGYRVWCSECRIHRFYHLRSASSREILVFRVWCLGFGHLRSASSSSPPAPCPSPPPTPSPSPSPSASPSSILTSTRFAPFWRENTEAEGRGDSVRRVSTRRARWDGGIVRYSESLPEVCCIMAASIEGGSRKGGVSLKIEMGSPCVLRVWRLDFRVCGLQSRPGSARELHRLWTQAAFMDRMLHLPGAGRESSIQPEHSRRAYQTRPRLRRESVRTRRAAGGGGRLLAPGGG